MSIVTRVTLVVSAAALMVTGCDEVRGDACACEEEVSAREGQFNGTLINGTWINGTWINGTWINGTLINGTWINGSKLYAPDGSNDYIQPLAIDLKGNAKAQSVSLVGSELRVVTTNGATLTGTGLEKARLEFDTQESGAKKVKKVIVRGVRQLAPGSDVWLYDLDFKAAQGGWQPLCTDPDGNPTEAILLSDLWNGANGDRRSPGLEGTVTFACRGYALAKCVEMGYKPWASANGTSLADFHQACTRMVRADYCGNGESHTVNGTQIHVLDQVGIQKLDANLSFVSEAEWGPNGALCLNPNNMRTGAESLSCQLPTCGAAFASGGLIQSGKVVAGP